MEQATAKPERRNFLAQFIAPRFVKPHTEWEQVLDPSTLRMGDVVFDSGRGCYYAGTVIRGGYVKWVKAEDNIFEFPIRQADIDNGHIWKQVPWEEDDDA